MGERYACTCIIPITYHDSYSYIIYSNKDNKHRSLSKIQIYQQVYVLIQKPDLLLVYRCSSPTVYSITIEVYHDINPIHREYQRRHISIVFIQTPIYQQVYVLLVISYAYMSNSRYCILDHDRPLS